MLLSFAIRQTKGESDILWPMTRRWEEKHDKPMSEEELDAFRQTLRDKDHFALDREYTKAHDACKLVREVPPRRTSRSSSPSGK